jgi:hypothetical protein
MRSRLSTLLYDDKSVLAERQIKVSNEGHYYRMLKESLQSKFYCFT